MVVLVSAMLFACSSACQKETPTGGEEQQSPDPDPQPEQMKIAGTVIKDGNNLVGLITDEVSGAPIAGVPVTDGFSWTLTDRHGVYQFVANENCRNVYYSLPSGYDTAVGQTSHLPLFYSTKKIKRSEVNRNDFKLHARVRNDEEFAFAVLGDIHIKNATALAQFKKGALAGIKDYMDANYAGMRRFGISEGDIIDNCYSQMWPDIKTAMGSVQLSNGDFLPFYCCIGNHDHDCSLGSTDLDFKNGYVSTFGPTDYSFNVGNVHFVVIDNFEALGKSGTSSTSYLCNGECRITSSQYDWLKQDLELVQNKESKMVVLVEHAHLRGFTTREYYKETLELLTQFYDAYIFSGHAHICESYKFNSYKTKSGEPVKERIHGVPMGNFWLSQYSPDGSPASFYVYKVKGNHLDSWEYRAVGKGDEQMRLYDSNDNYGSDAFSWKQQEQFASGNYLLAHVYHGDEDWSVRLEHDGQSEPMTFFNTRFTDWCINAYNTNVAKLSTSYKYYWDKSENWWYIKLDKPISEMTGWKVVATARYGLSTERREYSCAELIRDINKL